MTRKRLRYSAGMPRVLVRSAAFVAVFLLLPHLSVLASEGGVDVGRTSTGAGAKLATGVSDGSFSYDLPLTIPPGRNGIQPSISLSYNSNARSESSIFGYGWNISIPYIERRNYIGSEQMFGHAAFYSSMSGDLASTTDATVFKEKVSDGEYLAYTFIGNKWTVVDKRGTTYTFGHASSTQQYATSSPGNTSKWMLEEVRDLNGNYVSYSYTKDGGQIYPDVITYTGNGATPGVFDVHFTKELRTDIATSTAMGFEVVTKYRISEIKAEVNDSWVRKYTLGYTTGDNGARSFLSSVTEAGSDGTNTVTLPASTYGYQSATKSWTEDTATAIPQPFVDENYGDYGTRIAEVNGDGLPDLLLRTADNSLNRVYLNTGSGWTYDSSWTIPAVIASSTAAHPGSLLVDVNADGLIDIAESREQATSTIYMNTGSGWTNASTTVPVAFGRSDGGDNGVRVADVNGDGLPDLVRYWDGEANTNRIYLNNGANWVVDTAWSLPEPTVKTGNVDPGTRLVDVNGDGLADVVRNDNTQNKVYLQNGDHGWSLAPTWLLPTNITDASGNDRGVRFEDINGDGLVDVINSVKENGTTSTGTFINTGSGWTLDSSWQMPIPIVEYVGGVHKDAGTRFVDWNGDGLTDILGYRSNAPSLDVVYNRAGVKPDLLATTTNAQGGTTAMTYKASSLYRDGSNNKQNPFLPLALDTVQKVAYNDGLGTWDTEYVYEGGFYYAGSVRDRKFAGFEKVSEIDDLGYVTKQYFHQGSTTSSTIGEYSDHIAKIGKPFRKEVYDASSNLYAKSIYKWDRYDRGDGASFVKQTDAVDFSYDGDSDHKEKAESYAYNDSAGLLTRKTLWGEVTGQNDGTFSDAGTDKFTTSYAYATSTATSTIQMLSEESTLDQDGGKVRESKQYYDTLALGSLNKGNPTKTEQWKTGVTYIDTEKTYNSYGLVTETKDPRDKVTTYAYDSLNLYPATTTNPLSQAVVKTYDYSSGKVATTTDANGRVFASVYDALDRVKEEKQPDLSSPSSLVTKTLYQYTDTGLPRKVQKTDYLSSATSTETYVFTDGFGRKLEERTEAEGANYAVKDFRYDTRGLLKSESLPYFSTGTTYTGTSSPPSSTLLVRSVYDPLQRLIALGNSVGTTTTAYDDWTTTVTDAEGNVKDFTNDAHGRLSTMGEHNGGSTYTTAYQYDGNGSLKKITDAEGNVRNFTYDGLGRRLTAEDLHDTADGTFGSWSYTYDDAGNTTSYTDPKSQIIDLTYDDLNRVLTENYTGAAGTEITYSYDSCTEGIGRLCTATSTDAVTAYAYNALGFPASETKTIGGTAYATSYTYDRKGNKTGITYPDGAETAYVYNAAGLPESVSHKEPGGSFVLIVSNFDYAPTGALTTKEFANGVDTAYTYDVTKLYRLTNILTTDSDLGGAGDASEGLGPMLLGDSGVEFAPPAEGGNNERNIGVNLIPAESALDLLGLETATTTPAGVDDALAEGGPLLPEVPVTPLVPDPALVIPIEMATTTPPLVELPIAPTQPFLLEKLHGRPAPKESARIKTSGELGRTADGDPIFTAQIYQNDVQYIDASGQLAGIDTTLVDEPLAWTMTKAPYGARLAKDGGPKLLTYRNGDTELYFSSVNGQASAGRQVTDNHETFVRYPDALGKHVDIEVRLDTTLVRKEAVLKNPSALASLAQNGEYAEVPFLLQSNNTIDIVAAGEKLSVSGTLATDDGVEVTSGGQTVAYFLPPVATDAQGDTISIEIEYVKTPEGIVLKKRLPLSWLATAAYPVRTDTVVSYYSVEEGDGELEYANSGAWNTAHDAASATDTNAGAETARFESKHAAGNYRIKRVVLPFDTSALPDNAVVDAATLKAWITSPWNDGDDDGSDFVRLVQTTTASPTSIAYGDYDDVGAVDNPTAGATDIDISNTGSNQWLTLTFNATGRSWVNPTGYTKLGLREGHDATDVAPTSNTTTGLTIFTANRSGTSLDPLLEVTYHTNAAPSAPTGLLAEGQTNPVDITDSTPEFSAVVQDDDAGEIAASYQLQVATSTAFSPAYWDTTKTALASSTPVGQRIADISYAGSNLASSTTYYWRIKFWDDDNVAGVWSTATSTFSLAPTAAIATDLLQDISFTYDNIGNITALTDRSGTGAAKTLAFSYDDLNRLTMASTTSASSTPYRHTYAYSSLGNITGMATSTATTTYAYGETGYTNPHAPTAIGAASLSYDQNGNLTASSPWTYAFDYRNRMTTTGNGTATSTYAYDHTTERIKKTANSVTTIYPNDLWNKATSGATATTT
ncbi:VCBS repeat-containing protein, partial [Candidatus Kaiserbacteria bacterium]|nr:VCBS repeat-containing protein [Candidatus Kaiserbacteria bacterium]